MVGCALIIEKTFSLTILTSSQAIFQLILSSMKRGSEIKNLNPCECGHDYYSHTKLINDNKKTCKECNCETFAEQGGIITKILGNMNNLFRRPKNNNVR